ncbi:bifunctional 2-polyprenyl-6-hydroxyphenol methylase/3-demethylubiquinol 3-O-methyltransferase UbiG [Nocardia sp. BSTN01]|nr:bifunctional 2-polyprenyl-6-hydroxyphenol methylase/3-demethylubiquinol 3-O-methyltransferase UbiG [Nocardia sp. BSTN01]
MTAIDNKTLAEQQFFGAFAEHWWDDDSSMNNLKSFNPVRFGYFERFVDRWAGAKVLDVGCGGGFTAEYLAKRGAVVSGIDASAELIGAARKHASTVTELPIDYTVGTAEQLPYEDASFDIVTCVDVLEHVIDVSQVVAEIHRVLKPGGLFLWDTINRTPMAFFSMIVLPEYILRIVPKGAHQYSKFIKPTELAAIFDRTGFEQVESPVGIMILGQRQDGSLKMFQSRDKSATYMGVARKGAAK